MPTVHPFSCSCLGFSFKNLYCAGCFSIATQIILVVAIVNIYGCSSMPNSWSRLMLFVGLYPLSSSPFVHCSNEESCRSATGVKYLICRFELCQFTKQFRYMLWRKHYTQCLPIPTRIGHKLAIKPS